MCFQCSQVKYSFDFSSWYNIIVKPSDEHIVRCEDDFIEFLMFSWRNQEKL